MYFAAISSTAAQRQAAEDQMRRSFCDAEENPQTTMQTTTQPHIFSQAPPTQQTWPAPVAMAADSQISPGVSREPRKVVDSSSSQQTVGESISTVQDKLKWATEQLRICEHPEMCIQWCKVVQQCADSMISLYTLKTKI